MGIDLCGRGWATPETREAPVDVRWVQELQSRLAKTDGGERVPAGSICDTARRIAPDAEALEKKGERAAANAARKILEKPFASVAEYEFPPETDFDQRLTSAPHADSDASRRIYG